MVQEIADRNDGVLRVCNSENVKGSTDRTHRSHAQVTRIERTGHTDATKRHTTPGYELDECTALERGDVASHATRTEKHRQGQASKGQTYCEER